MNYDDKKENDPTSINTNSESKPVVNSEPDCFNCPDSDICNGGSYSFCGD